jgi:thymidylate synthase (FAD)
MPQNKNLQKVDLPMVLKFDQKPKTQFHNNLDALKVELVDHPTRQQAWNVAWHYVKATWADRPDIDPTAGVSERELSKNLEDVFGGRTLPAPMECLGFTFRLSGLSFQEVTHIIRHRAGTFAAQCTGDRDLRDDDAVIPEPVQNSPEFLERWKKLVEESKKLYADMTDSKTVSMMDARLILPKCMTSFYYMRLPLKELIGFIYQRMDTQIQPAADNLLASRMAVEVAKVIPEFTSVIDFSKPDMHYIKTFRVKEGDKFVSRGTNLYWPIKKNDIFEYNPADTIYQSTREDLNGTHGEGPQKRFTALWDKDMSDWEALRATHSSWKSGK